jgi:hypothetical protein
MKVASLFGIDIKYIEEEIKKKKNLLKNIKNQKLRHIKHLKLIQII